jgi:hypothetical protein
MHLLTGEPLNLSTALHYNMHYVPCYTIMNGAVIVHFNIPNYYNIYIVKCFESDDSQIFRHSLPGTSLVTGLLEYISAVNHRLQKQNFGNSHFLCDPSVAAKVPKFKRSTIRI